MNSIHTPVLLSEVVDTFKNIGDGVILDCTLGYGGHSKALLDSIPNIKIIACDQDDMAIKYCQDKFKDYKDRIEIYKSNFSQIIKKIPQENIKGILADIGVSSLQLDLNERGFGLKSDVLDMRMDSSNPINAKTIVNNYTQDELQRVFCEYGELPNAKIIAQKIIKARENKEIISCKELSQIVGSSNLKNRSISVATLVFQAIRIEVNKELDVLKELLNSIQNSKIDETKLAIISFHSLEDRIIKDTFKKWQSSCICPIQAMRCECGNNHAIGKIITKKPITPTDKEISDNPRSSCSKMRIFKIKRQR
ncbi:MULTISPECIES: 16S rRNA (cytosine(1402)-N(4))-methyltransferase RsmH [Campylobacter]|uniref:16S rRNA (cytosine(1402)-N(4))-methyltransferase RsmH n=1 Tax=Campylobacter TaxID=194 RepID=UPI000A355AAB|nr:MULTISPECIES: 16S rRNA (cytosine(1402)-N(4))-methyltransferase RsmH [unclassified Campylobacter]MCR8679447.1 16S rRNA (cytosine(1402)-N(4))-methyltransferase RsmH [Campylobacter sp. RM19072]MCR8696493.1 16S rRNA (cytosine(1402)-N(4))-methyltransferase RsmH [Campylobacter sp. RM19073]MEE3703973.1 16S rRNA (cytosine(1402)-N(4))-methyltransferase RsmH [Campylobacter sp. CX2-8023-23]MEE3775876.1 16S rRNA (cytosine(1402)-N(4))-methyltransferase RsmH [Campylobacter sp. CX2-4080-23]